MVNFHRIRYILDKSVPVPAAAYNSRASKSQPEPSVWPGRILDVQDVEENIWSPRLGVKGKVDLTIRVEMKTDGAKAKVVPLELKTGRPSGSSEHRGQVILYAMMMSEAGPQVESGLLLYLRNSALMEVKAGVCVENNFID